MKNNFSEIIIYDSSICLLDMVLIVIGTFVGLAVIPFILVVSILYLFYTFYKYKTRKPFITITKRGLKIKDEKYIIWSSVHRIRIKHEQSPKKSWFHL